jgi:hypothetical protein
MRAVTIGKAIAIFVKAFNAEGQELVAHDAPVITSDNLAAGTIMMAAESQAIRDLGADAVLIELAAGDGNVNIDIDGVLATLPFSITPPAPDTTVASVSASYGTEIDVPVGDAAPVEPPADGGY